MSVIADLILWSQQTFLPYGELGLFAVAFMESSFFPIPPDLLLIPLVLINPQLGLWYALVCTVGSVLGALLGYYIGLRGGRPVLIKIAGTKKTDKVERYFKKYGDWAIAIAAFTPIPYKIFTIAAGVFRHNVKSLLWISVIGRGARFFLVAGLLMLLGPEILNFIESYFELFTFLVVVGVIVLYHALKKAGEYFDRKVSS
ncbi:MAG: DedA family protein [Candidatus Aenigmarchaeota archaeon]|nr:DedA family protein [Candidatus Aenigmarchaeota archaeon]